MTNIHHLHRVVTETEAKELVLDSYVMHIQTKVCGNCDCGERCSDMFEVWAHPTKTRSTALNVLRPVKQFDRTLPIAYVELPERRIPLCSDCIGAYAPQTAPRPVPAISREAWAATLKRKYEAAAQAAKPATKPAPPTLDQL